MTQRALLALSVFDFVGEYCTLAYLLSSVYRAASLFDEYTAVHWCNWSVFKIQQQIPACDGPVVCACLQLASGIYSFACSLWSHHTDCFLQQIYARDEAAALGSLERTLLSLKGIRCSHTLPASSTVQANHLLMARNKNRVQQNAV